MKLRPTTLLPLVLFASACHDPTAAMVEQTGHTAPAVARKASVDLARSASLPPAPSAPGPVTAEVISHGPRDEKRIALTFDACSTRDISQYDEAVTQVLERTHTPATIFLGGGWAHEEAAHVKQLAANPLIELANHTYTHPHLPRIKDESRIRTELERTQSEVAALSGKVPRLFRAPYGEYDDRVVRIAAELGLTTIEYDLASGDPDQHATKQRLIDWVLLKAQPGSIVVMHINHVHFHTAEALPEIITRLRARGFTLVTVSELLSASHGNEAAAVSRTEAH